MSDRAASAQGRELTCLPSYWLLTWACLQAADGGNAASASASVMVGHADTFRLKVGLVRASDLRRREEPAAHPERARILM